MAVIVCKNCDTHFKGNFCSLCGQSAKVEPITAKYFLHDIPHSILHIDKGFFYTLAKLFTNPGHMLKEYLAGRRVKHFRPFAFVIIMSTICFLLYKGIDYLVKIRFEKLTSTVYKQEISFFQQYSSLLVFIMIPVLSVCTWLFFKNKQYNFWEHFLANTYLAALVNVFLLTVKAVSCIRFYSGIYTETNYTIFMFIFMGYYGYAFSRLFYAKTTFKRIAYLFLMNFFLATIYLTAFSLTGIMSAWWKF